MLKNIDYRLIILAVFLIFLLGFATGLAAYDLGWRLDLKPATSEKTVEAVKGLF